MGIQNGTPGTNGTSGVFPGGNGGDGTAGGDARTFNAPADPMTGASATGGKGGNGGNGGDNPTGIGGGAGAGGAGGRAIATATKYLATGYASIGLGIDGGRGGSAGLPGNLGTPNQGAGANGGNGGHAFHGVVSATASNGGASADVLSFAGSGGDGSGAGYRGGNGGLAGFTTARASGTSAGAWLRQYAGNGGNGYYGADGGDGGHSVLMDAISGSANGGTFTLMQDTWGGPGGNGAVGGRAGSAISIQTFDDVAINGGSAAVLRGISYAIGGTGGLGAIEGRAGGNGYALLSLSGAAKVTADVTARGGLGAGSEEVGRTVSGAMGGAAKAEARAVSKSLTEMPVAHAISIGGQGGDAIGPGMLGGSGNSASSAKAFASGYSAQATAELTGGRGGDGYNGATGGSGGHAWLVNGVSGSANGGELRLWQTAKGGDGGRTKGGSGGPAGSGLSYLTYHEDKVSAFDAASIRAFSDAWAGYREPESGKGLSTKAANALSRLDLSGYRNVGGQARALGQQPSSARSGTTIANATVAATSTAGDGVATASAYSDFHATNFNAPFGFVGLRPTSTAKATASTVAGQLATATSWAMGSGFAKSTATTQTDGIVTSLNAFASAQVLGIGSAISTANMGQTLPNLTTDYGTYAHGTASPTSSVIAAALSAATNVNTVLGGPTATIFATGMQGGNSLQSWTGTRVYSSTITWSLDTRALSGDLILGFVDGVTHGAGMRDLRISVAIEGTTVLTKGFANNSRALSFLDDTAVNLGRVAQDADLQVSVSFQVVLNTVESGFGARYVLGTTDADRGAMPMATTPTWVGTSAVTKLAVLGQATAHAEVTLRSGTTIVGTATADDRGDWSLILPAGLPARQFVATTIAPSGETVYTANSDGVLRTVRAGNGYVLPELSDIAFIRTDSNAGASLTGNSTTNTISGGGGNDTLRGGAGADALSGGYAGTDTFVYAALEDSTVDPLGQDTIWDFGSSNTPDLIDLSLIDADTTLPGDQAFLGGKFISAFTGVAGELRLTQVDSTSQQLSGDVNGDGTADFMITIVGSPLTIDRVVL